MTDDERWPIMWQWFANLVDEPDMIGLGPDEIESAFVTEMMARNEYTNRFFGAYC